jgi:hypothetical protein
LSFLRGRLSTVTSGISVDGCSPARISPAARDSTARLPEAIMRDDETEIEDRFVVLIMMLVILVAAFIAILFVFATNF